MQERNSENPFYGSTIGKQETHISRRAFSTTAIATTLALAINPTEIFSQEKKLETRRPEEDYTILRSENLFNAAHNTNVQLHLFYDDRIADWDGHKTFRNMFKTYGAAIYWNQRGDIEVRASPNKDWLVEDKGTYVHIVSIGHPKKIEIYTNKPEHADDGPEDIAREFRRQRIQPQLVAHRAHNVFIDQTISRIPRDAKLVVLGSCDAAIDIDEINKKAPNAHIIAPMGTGTMVVTEPLVRMLNEEILSGRDISWSAFRERARRVLGGNPHFQKYRFPDQIRQ